MKRLIVTTALAASIFSVGRGPQAQAETKTEVEHHLVNSYDVYLINNKYGNQYTLAISVETGSLSDDPVRHAGRAHLWEHVIHNGTVKFPGSTAFNEITDKHKIASNAYTSDTVTYYYMTGLASTFQNAIELQGSMVSEPEWNEEAFLKEKKNVMDEAKKYESHSGFILDSAMMMNLLPEGHPWRMYTVGTQDQLAKMSLQDLRELYFTNYKPGSMKIIVAGNFTSAANGIPPLNKEQVLALIGEHYTPPVVPKEIANIPSNNKTVFPDINPTGQPQILELGSPQESEFTANIKFQIDSAMASENIFALEAMNDYLNLQGAGSISHYLKSQGLVTAVGFSRTKNNNLWIEDIYIQFTPAGAAKRYEVFEKIIGYIHRLAKDGVNQPAFDYIIKRNILSYANDTKSTQSLAKIAGDRLLEMYKGSPQDVFHYDFNFKQVARETVQQAFKSIFDPRRAVIGYMGSDVKSDLKAPVFQVPMKIINATPYVRAWTYAYTNGHADLKSEDVQIHPLEVPLEFSEKLDLPNRETRFVATGKKGIVAALEENHDLNEGAVHITMLNAQTVNTLEHTAAQKIVSTAFFERYAKELDYFNTMGTFAGVFSAKGNPKASLQTLKWILSRYFEFAPTEEEVHHAREKLRNAANKETNSFPAQTAAKTLLNDLSRQFSAEQIAIEASRLNAQAVVRLMSEVQSKANLLLAFYGSYTENDVRDLSRFLSHQIPLHLTETEIFDKYSADRVIEETRKALYPLSSNQSEFGFGIARAYQAPEPGMTRESVAFYILYNTLQSDVFNLNRTERSLGYVHSAALNTYRHQKYFLFYGQADGDEDEAKNNPDYLGMSPETIARAKLALTKQGWEELIAKVKTKTLSPDGFQSMINAEILNQQKMAIDLTVNAGTISQIIANYYDPLASTRPDPLTQRKFIEILKTLTADEIYAVGAKVLLDKPYFEVIQTRNHANCTDLLK